MTRHGTTVSARNRMRVAFVFISAALLLLYLYSTRHLLLAEPERQLVVSQNRKFKSVDLSQPGSMVWEIKAKDWQYTGQCYVSLVVDRTAGIPPEAYSRKKMTLAARVDAYAVTFEPVGKDKYATRFQAPRIIKNWYFNSDGAFPRGTKLWETADKTAVEFGLCGIQRYPWEDTYIAFTVEDADPVLAKTNPRLQIVGEFDYAVLKPLFLLRVLRDSSLICLAVCTVGLALLAIMKNERHAPPEL